MMADDQVLDQDFEFVGEVEELSKFGLQHFQFDDHVAEQLAPRGVGERAVISEFVNLADVMQEGASEQEIAVNLGIILAHKIARTEERHHMIEQSADISVMQSFGSRSIAVRLGNLRVRHESFHQRLEMGVAKGSDEG